ncbi:MAG: hypothetical protein WAM82_14570 [Thermoanaerobaculia bacterium]
MVWNWWPGPRLEQWGRLKSFDAQILTNIGLRRWFRFTGGRCLALFLGVIPALLFLNSFHISNRLRWPKDTDPDPAIKTEETEQRVWFWKHTGRLLRPSDLQKYALYGFLEKDAPNFQEIDRLAKRVTDYPRDANSYQSLRQLLLPFRLSTPGQASRVLSDVELDSHQQRVYLLEEKAEVRGPFRRSSRSFSARDQLAFCWYHMQELESRPKKRTDSDSAITTKEQRVWFWKHTGRLLRRSDLQNLYGFLEEDAPNLQEIDRLAKRVADYPTDANAYERLSQLLRRFRLDSTPAPLVLSDVKLNPQAQRVYFLEEKTVKGNGPFWGSSRIFSARNQLALTWVQNYQIQSFTRGEIESRISSAGVRRLGLIIYGSIGLLILWRRGGDWGYAFWLGLWFVGVGTLGAYRYQLFFFQVHAHDIWLKALKNPGANLLLTVFQALDALVIANMIAFITFLSCSAIWNWICWPTSRRRCLKSFSARPWLGRILYSSVLGGKIILVALIMFLCFWGPRIVLQVTSGNEDLALVASAVVFVIVSLGATCWVRARAGKRLTRLYFVAAFLFLTAQALALLSTSEVASLSIRSTTIMTLSYTMICGLIAVFLALVVRKNFLRLFTLRDASFVVTASLIMVLLKLSENAMEAGVKLFSDVTGIPESGSKILGLSAFVLLVPPAHRRIERFLLHLSLIKLNLRSRRPLILLRLHQIEEKIATALELLLNTQDPRGIGQIRDALSACGINEYTFMSRKEGRIFANSVSCSSSAQPDQLEISEMLLEFFRKHRAALDLDQLPYEWSTFFVQFELERLRMERPAKYLIPIKLGESLRGLLFVSKTSDERVLGGEEITDSIAEIALLTTQLRYQHFTPP